MVRTRARAAFVIQTYLLCPGGSCSWLGVTPGICPTLTGTGSKLSYLDPEAVDRAHGDWSIPLNSVSNAVHTFTATAIDRAGNQGASSQIAILGSSAGDKISGVPAGELIIGGKGGDQLTGSTGHDTFIFHSSFGKDTITGFDVNADVLAFDHTLFATVADILNHTKDVKSNAVIAYDGTDTVTLTGVTKAQLEAHQSDLLII